MHSTLVTPLNSKAMSKKLKLDFEDQNVIPPIYTFINARKRFIKSLGDILTDIDQGFQAKELVQEIAEFANFGPNVTHSMLIMSDWVMRTTHFHMIWRHILQRIGQSGIPIMYTAYRVQGAIATNSWGVMPFQKCHASLLMKHHSKGETVPADLRSLWEFGVGVEECIPLCFTGNVKMTNQNKEKNISVEQEPLDAIPELLYNHNCMWQGDIVEGLPKQPWDIINVYKWGQVDFQVIKLDNAYVVYILFMDPEIMY